MTFKLSAAALVALLGTTSLASAECADPIKVGVLHSLSGTMAISETTLKDNKTPRAVCSIARSRRLSSILLLTGLCLLKKRASF